MIDARRDGLNVTMTSEATATRNFIARFFNQWKSDHCLFLSNMHLKLNLRKVGNFYYKLCLLMCDASHTEQKLTAAMTMN